MNRLQQTALLIVIVYCILLGMYGFFEFDVIKYVLKGNSMGMRWISLVVFLCGMICISIYQKDKH
ncbi:MAG: DUF378 domain-containing protein [Erysipelotrichaceae bacterium]|nr:DUF378 domain-containing protein [Erysipelotrichaceae bacterium]MBR3693209.1 DUF378 domain-containing protein [Erysipelotrichales bacterium]